MATKPAAAKKKAAAAKAATTPKLAKQSLRSEVATLEKDVAKLQTEVTAARKHTKTKTSKHAKAAKAKHTGSAKHGTATMQKRGLAVPGGVPCCAAQGLAASLRLAGKPVTADDVLGLYWATPGADEDGTTILAALQAAQRHSLAGAYPEFRPASVLADGVVAGLTLAAGPHTVTFDRGGVRTWDEWRPVPRSFADAVEEAWEVTWL